MLIKEPLEFPDLGKLIIHGEKHASILYVWYNLTTHGKHPNSPILKGVGNMVRPASEWKKAATIATSVAGVAATVVSAVGASVMTAIACPLAVPVAMVGTAAAGMYCTEAAVKAVGARLGQEVPRVLGEPEPDIEEVSENESINSTTAEYRFAL